MIDNLFIVESPLQALVAVELSLQFSGKNNGIIYRLSGQGREKNDEQILRVIELGNWSFKESLNFPETRGLTRQICFRKYIVRLKNRFRHKVRTLFFGEFRSQWMHLARFAVASEKCVLMDDGAATLIAKHRYIDQGIYYPEDLWSKAGFLKKALKKIIFFGLLEKEQAQKPLVFASAFLRDESEFKVDFSLVRQKMISQPACMTGGEPKAFFFGSKYSENGILSKDCEVDFISHVLNYYHAKGLGVVYCAHRDESEEKLSLIQNVSGLEVVRPALPAELFLLERDAEVAEIGAFYSSVINNLSLIFPEKLITSFRLDPNAINPNNRKAVELIYSHFEKKGVPVQSL
jgi:hypothetical protein